MSYAENGFEVAPGFLTPQQISVFLASLEEVEARRVKCHDESITWDEKNIAKGSIIWEFFMSQATIRWISNLHPMKTFGISSWACIYSRGEHIDAHKDGAGDTQFLICLANGQPDWGGQLILRPNGVEHEVFLHPGDAVLFKASQIEHETMPCCPPPGIIAPRITAVARFFVQN
jgi:hypothetical protein